MVVKVAAVAPQADAIAVARARRSSSADCSPGSCMPASMGIGEGPRRPHHGVTPLRRWGYRVSPPASSGPVRATSPIQTWPSVNRSAFQIGARALVSSIA